MRAEITYYRGFLFEGLWLVALAVIRSADKRALLF